MSFRYLLLTVITAVSIPVLAQNETYVIQGSSDLQDGLAILDVYSKEADTVKIVNGKFQFTGTIGGPRFMSIQVTPGRPGRIVLEPGKITVHYQKGGTYKIGGTDNNKRLQIIDEQIAPYHARVAEAWKGYNNSKGEERARYFREWEVAQEEKRRKTREQILADPNFSGFLTALPAYRDETATAVRKFLDQFKHFSEEDGYQRMADFYKGAANTDFGVVAPDWTRPDDKGKTISLSSLRGKYVLLDFWYVGCVWCRRMTPHLIPVYNDLKSKGLEIVSISVDPKKDEEKWREAMKEDGAPWLQAWDYEKKLPAEYGVLAYPTMFLLDPEGKVVEKIIGYREGPALREMFAKYNLK